MVGSYRLEASKAQRAGGVCLANSEAVTRSLTFTLHNCSRPLESLSLSSAPPVCHKLISSSRHRVTLQLHRTCSVSGATRPPRLLRQCANGLQSARDLLSVQQVSPSPLHASQKITKWNATVRDNDRKARCQGAAPPATSTVFCWQLARSHRTIFFFVVWINKWKLWLMALWSAAWSL